MRLACQTLLLTLLFMVPVPALALSVLVIVDTTPLAGVSGFIGFDFVSGDGVPNNTISIQGFGTDGLFGPPSFTGDASGDLLAGPLLLGDSQFFNSALVPVQFGTVVGFELHTTEAGTSLPAPDEFSFFILDGFMTTLPTTDPSGANALLVVDIQGTSTVPDVYLAGGAQVQLFAIPEAGLGVMLGLVAIGLARKRRSRRMSA